MELTPIGFVLLPLSLIFFFRPSALLQLALVSAAFGAAVPVIVSLGGEPFGLPTGFLPALLFTAVLALDHLGRGVKKGEKEVERVMLPMILFAVLAVATAFLFPRLFSGQFMVWPQRVGEINLQASLAPDAGNITQSLYLVVNTATMVFAALYASRARTRNILFVRAYLASGYLVVGLCLWQLANKLTGIYYPEDLLYSNPRWAILSEQAFGNVNRLNGPFTEPAALAGFLCGITFACLSMLLRKQGGLWVRFLLLLSILCILLSTSTTGIVVVAVFVPAVLLRSATAAERRAIGLTIVGVLGGALALGVVTYVVVPSLARHVDDAVSTVIDATLDKPDSDSGIDRTTKDIDSLGIVASSYGLGAGWGSVRSSSLIPGMLANSGVLGVSLLIWFGARVTRLVARARQCDPASETYVAMNAMAGSIIGSLFPYLLSGPTIDEIDFFLRLGVLLGAAVRLCGEVRARAPARPPPMPSPLPLAGGSRQR